MTVWGVQTHETVLDIESHIETVFKADMSSDSTKFATGSVDKHAFIWSLTTGKIISPLQHEYRGGRQFFQTGDPIAPTAAENPEAKSVRIYDSENPRLILQLPLLRTQKSETACGAIGNNEG